MKNTLNHKIDSGKLSYSIFRRFFILIAILISTGPALLAQCCSLVNSLNISTGFDPVTGTVFSTGVAANVLPPGAAVSILDPRWNVTSLTPACAVLPGVPAPAPYSALVIPPQIGWLGGGPAPQPAQWIGIGNFNCYSTNNPPGSASPGWGVYRANFSRSFCLCQDDVVTINIPLFRFDNRVDVTLDGPGGTSTLLFTSGPTNTGVNAYAGNRSINFTTPLAAGCYTLNFLVDNWAISHLTNGHGLFVQGAVTSLLNSIQSEAPNPIVISGSILGDPTLCQNETKSYSYTPSTTGGLWQVSPASVATVSPTGDVTGVGPGTAIITYTSPCNRRAFKTITVNPAPGFTFSVHPGPVVCSGDPYTITAVGVTNCSGCSYLWGADGMGATTPSIVRSYTTLLGGAYLYTLTLTNSDMCSTTQSTSVVVHPVNDAGGLYTMLDPGSVICSGSHVYVMRSGGMGGGTWSLAGSVPPSVATISPIGMVTFGTVLVPTTVTVNYTVSTPPCPPAVASMAITVYPRPIFTVSGPLAVCEGDMPMFCASVSPTSTAGTGALYSWSWGGITTACATHPAIYATGSYVRSVTVTNSYGCSSTSPFIFTVFEIPKPYIVANPTDTVELCIGDHFPIEGHPNYSGTYTETWSSSNSLVATVSSVTPSSPPIGAVADIVGISAGTAIVTYSVSGTPSGCSAYATYFVRVLPSPGPISGAATLCMGSSGVYTTMVTSGGFWTTSDPTIATVSVDPVTGYGVVTGVSGGIVVLYYYDGTRNSKCPAKFTITVVPELRDICPTWHFDPVAGIVFDIIGAPPGAVVHYTCYTFYPVYASLGSFTTTGTTIAVYPAGTTRLCIDKVTYAGCTWLMDCCVTLNTGGGAKANNDVVEVDGADGLTLAPNPNNGEFLMNWSMASGGSENATLVCEIIDILGHVIYEEKVLAEKGIYTGYISIPDGIANGVYVFRVSGAGKQRNVRFVLER